MRSLTDAIRNVITPASQESLQESLQEPLTEAKKKIGEYSNGGNVTKVYKLSGEHYEGDPYKVELHRDGKHYEPADYYTDDKEDAHGTAQHMVKESLNEDWASITNPAKVFGKKDAPKKTYGKEYDAEQDDNKEDEPKSTGHDASGLADALGLKPKDEWKPLTLAQRKGMTPSEIRAHNAKASATPVPSRVHRMQDDDEIKEDIQEAKGTDGQYHPNNPKIDLYHDGKYVASTNWSSTVKHAVATAKEKYPNMTGKWKGEKSIKEEIELVETTEFYTSVSLDEEVLTEAYKKSEHAAAHDAFMKLAENHPARIAYENASPDEQRKLRCHHIYVNRMIISGGDQAKIEARKVKFYNHVNKLHGIKPVKANTKLGESVESLDEMTLDAAHLPNNTGRFELFRNKGQDEIHHVAGKAGKRTVLKSGAAGSLTGEFAALKSKVSASRNESTEFVVDDMYISEGVLSALKDTLTPQKGETWKDVGKDMLPTAADVKSGFKTIGKGVKTTLKMLKNPVQYANQQADKKKQ